MTVHIWEHAKCTLDKRKKIIGKLCKREKGTGWRSSFLNKMTTGSSRDGAGRKLGKGGLGAEAEIGEGPWATGRLGLPLASG